MLSLRFRMPSRCRHGGYRWLRSRRSAALAADAVVALLVMSLVMVPAAGQRQAHSARPKLPALTVGELPGRSTATSTTRRNKDGSYTTTLYSGPVNYRAPDGSIRPIDTSLYPDHADGYGWRSGANVFRARLKSVAGGDLVELRLGGRVMRMSAEGAARRAARRDGAQVSYPGAFPGADLRYQVTNTGVKETIDIAGPGSPASYTFRLSPADGGAGLTAAREPDGAYLLGAAPLAGGAFVLAAPVVQEATGAHGSAAPAAAAKPELTVRRDGRDLVARLSIDGGWLRAPGRRFPVRVDPTLTIQPDAQDATFAASCGGCTPFVVDRLYVGSDTSAVWRGALQFDLSSIPAGVTVSSAQLGLYYDGYCLAVNGTCTGVASHDLEAHRMTAPWSPSTTSSQLRFDSTTLSTVTITTSQQVGWLYWPITLTVQNWLSGAQPNDGLLLKATDETLGLGGLAAPSRSYAGSSTVQPELQVTYSSDAVSLLPPTTLHSNGAELTWTAYSSPSGAPFGQYAVYRSTTANFTPSPATLLTTITDPAVTSYRDTTAAPSRTFSYAVVANSAKSNEVSVSLPADGQATKTLQPGPDTAQDTFMNYAAGQVNCDTYGADGWIYVGSDTSAVYRGLLRFSLNDIPPTATISNATLSVWQSYPTGNAVTLEAHQATRAWTEGTGINDNAQCTGDGATWYDASTGVNWDAQGGDYVATAAASLAKAAGQQPSWDNLNLTSLTQQWVNGGAANLGVLLKFATEPATAGNWVTYTTGDFNANPSLRPKLTLTYTDGSHALPPAVSVSKPGPGATVAGTAVTLTAAASDDGAVDHVDFLVDGTVVGTDRAAPYTLSWNSTGVANGSHTITARAVDTAGNSATSSAVSVTVNNLAPPSTSLTAPAGGSTVSGTAVTVTANAAATSPDTVSKVDFYADNQLFATSTASPYTAAWNTLDPAAVAYDGSHTLTAKVTDSTGLTTTSAPVSVTVANTAGTRYRAGMALGSGSTVPATVTYDPTTTTQQQFGVAVTVTNNSTSTFTGTGDTLAYRWYSPDSPSVVTTGPATPLGTNLAPGSSVTLTMLVPPPTLAAGVNSAAYQLVFDLYDAASGSWFAARGNPPVTAQVQVLRRMPVGLGLEKYYQYDIQSVGGGLDSLVNVASGNLVLDMTPWQLPGRGLSSVLNLTYNGLENHSHSPVGNNWSLAITSLTRFGTPLDVHPNKADTIAGVSNKLIGVTDGDGTLHVYTGTTNPDGTTSWTPPPGFDLYLRSITTDTTSARYWAVSRPDHVTFYYNYGGWPTAVVDKNGNTVSFTETATPPGEDPGGPAYRITTVTDPGGRAINVSYYTKAQTDNAHQRGRISDITDHLGHVLHFDYYTDGNLLRITQRGGTNADGSFLADRSWVFTYLTSNGAGPAIPTAADRVNPDPKTPNEDSQIYSVRDPRGHETLYGYYLNSDGPTLAGRVKTLTDRAAHATGYSYDTTNAVTTVTDPLSHATTYTYDASGRVTKITNPLGQHTSEAWTADNQLRMVTEDNGAFRSYSYNANGLLTDYIDQDGDHTKLTYTDRPLDATDTGTHWSLLATKTAPLGVATGSGYQWQFGYDAAGNLLTATDPLNHTTSYCYNLPTAPACNTANDPSAPGTIEAVTDFNGHTTTYANYDPNGRPQKVTDPMGRVTQFGYDADGNMLWTQTPLHATASGTDTRSYRNYFDYDSFNRLGRRSQPKSTALDRGQLIWTDTSYDPNNNITAAQDDHYGQQDAGNGAKTTYGYDAMDRKTLTTGPDTQADPAGQRTKLTYDAGGRMVSEILPIGVQSGIAKDHTTTYGYDAADELTSQTQYTVNSSGTVTDTRTTYYCYDDVANMVTVTAPNARLSAAPACPATTTTANTTIYTYDNAHQRLSTKDPDGHLQSEVYDADGNVIQRKDASGNVTTNSYDQKDQLTKVVAPYVHGGRNTTTINVYDANGNKIRDISARAYDASTDKTTFTDYVTSYSYDSDNEMVRQTTPSDANTPAAYIHYYFAADGRQTAVSLPVTQSDPTQVSAAAKTVNTLFDPGWVASSNDPANPTARFDYTAQGWQKSRTPDKPSGGPDTSLEQQWAYYPDGKAESYTDQGGQASSYHYSADNDLTYAKTAHGLNAGQAPVEIYADYTGYDELAATHYRPTSSTTFTATAYTYDHDGNVAERDDNAQQTLSSQTTNSAGVPISWTFTQNSGGAPVVNTMKYDTADWLTNQYNNGTTTSCTGDKRIDTTWTATGWEKTRSFYTEDSTCTYALKQKTAWTYFDNGKLKADTITSQYTATNPSGTVLETHTVGYETNGIYLDGNRTSDAFALNGPGSTVCTGATASCTQTYSYDARDRVTGYTDGHGGTTSYTFDQNNSADPSIRAGNITTQTTPSGTTTSTYKGDQLTSATKSGVTTDDWYDSLGRLTCITTTAGSASSCNVATNGSVSSAVITSYSYDFMDRFTATSTYSLGTLTSNATYTYDALDRTAKETEKHPSANLTRTTTFNYEGLTNLATKELWTNKDNTGTTTSTDTKTYDYDAYGNRISLKDSNVAGGTTTTSNFTYGYDLQGSTSLLVDQSNGSVKASYGYTPYGASDSTLSKGDTAVNTPFNPYRYTAKRLDSGSKSYDMGTRRFDPATQRFLQLDQFQGALADLQLSSDPLTQNRYDLGASNPLSGVEYDGHMLVASGGGGGSAPSPKPTQQQSSTASSYNPATCMRFGLNCSGASQAIRQQINRENSSSWNLLGWLTSTWKSLSRGPKPQYNAQECTHLGVTCTNPGFKEQWQKLMKSRDADYHTFSLGLCAPGCIGVSFTIDSYGRPYFGVSGGVGTPGVNFTYTQGVLGSKKRPSPDALSKFIGGAGRSVQAGVGSVSFGIDQNGQQSAQQFSYTFGTRDWLPQWSNMWSYTWPWTWATGPAPQPPSGTNPAECMHLGFGC
jgi:RHS repeat-associated protein